MAKKALYIASILIILISLALLVEWQRAPEPGAPQNLSTTEGVFKSNVLGLSLTLPYDGTVAEMIRKPDGEKNAYDTWTLSVYDLPFSVRATNERLAGYSYEGPGLVVAYAGDAIEGQCSHQRFIDRKNYEVTIYDCKELVNPQGVPYVYYDLCYKDVSGYGVTRRPFAFGAKVAHAQAQARCSGTIGVFFQTRSKEFPGLIISKTWYSETYPDYAVAKQAINETMGSVRYLR